LEPKSLYYDQLAKRLKKEPTAPPRDSTPIAVPGVFNSTQYVGKSSEVADNGYYVGNLANNSYMDYVINVQTAGAYTIVLNTARNSTAARTVTVNSGATKLTDINIPNGVCVRSGYGELNFIRRQTNFEIDG